MIALALSIIAATAYLLSHQSPAPAAVMFTDDEKREHTERMEKLKADAEKIRAELARRLASPTPIITNQIRR